LLLNSKEKALALWIRLAFASSIIETPFWLFAMLDAFYRKNNTEK
jgi:hypothetical protein